MQLLLDSLKALNELRGASVAIHLPSLHVGQRGDLSDGLRCCLDSRAWLAPCCGEEGGQVEHGLLGADAEEVRDEEVAVRCLFAPLIDLAYNLELVGVVVELLEQVIEVLSGSDGASGYLALLTIPCGLRAPLLGHVDSGCMADLVGNGAQPVTR